MNLDNFFATDKINKLAICKTELERNGKTVLCGMQIRNAKAYNMKRHLERAHPAEFQLIFSAEEKKKEDNNLRKRKPAGTIDTEIEVKKQFIKFQSELYVPSDKVTIHISPETFKKGVIQMVVTDGVSLKTFGGEGFQLVAGQIAKQVGFNTGYESIRNSITKLAEDKRAELKEALALKLVYLKIDVVTRHQRSYLGINIQYYSQGKIQIKTLALIDTEGKHNSDVAKKMVENTLCSFGIQKSQIISVSVNNAANMTRAVALSKDDENKDDFSEEEDSDTKSLELEKEIGNSVIWETNPHLVLLQWFPEQSSDLRLMHCMIHSLHLAILDGIKQDYTSQFLSKIRTVVEKLRVPRLISLAKKQYKVIPILDNEIWSDSTFRMIERLLVLRSFCEQVAAIDPVFFLSPEMWEEVEHLGEILRKPNDIAIRLHKSNVTPGEFLKEWYILKEALEKDQGKFAVDIKNSMQKQEEKLFKNDIFLAAIYADARYRILLIPEQVVLAKEGLKTVAQLVLKHETEYILEIANMQKGCTEAEQPVRIPSTSTEDDDFERKLDQKERRRQINLMLKSEKGIFEQIFEDDCKVIEKLGRLRVNSVFEAIEMYPNRIQDACRIVSSLPITQANVERLFSAVKFICTYHKSSTKNDILEAILFLRMNQEF